jgi:hypothetical protein
LRPATPATGIDTFMAGAVARNRRTSFRTVRRSATPTAGLGALLGLVTGACRIGFDHHPADAMGDDTDAAIVACPVHPIGADER